MKKGNYLRYALIAALIAFVVGSAMSNKNATQQGTTGVGPGYDQTTQNSGQATSRTQSVRQSFQADAAKACGFVYSDMANADVTQLTCYNAKMEEHQALVAERLYNNPPSNQRGMDNIFTWIFLGLVGFALFRFIQMRRQGGGGGGGGAMSFGKSKARKIESSKDKKTFADIAGAEDAKKAAAEFVDILKYPQKYLAQGGKIPKGALLVGPPGNGKTLLGKAIAGEAGVPFFYVSGSDFVEMFVGVGASRVRDMFEQARKEGPAIIFIDEIDAVGKKRGGGAMGGNDEREQTINALLVEMDGIGTDGEPPVIVFAATNRPDTLDPALTRTGRLDEQIKVNPPSFNARIKIFQVHLRGKPVSRDVDLRILSSKTSGMSGSDIEHVCDRAANTSARRNMRLINHSLMEETIDMVKMGAENRSLILTEEQKKATAYHEAAHAVVIAHEITQGNSTDVIDKATIVPHRDALGFVSFRPSGDPVSTNFKELKAKLRVAVAGRVAEEITYTFEGVSTGPSNDYQQMSKISQYMVRQGGYKNIGRFAEDQGAMFGMGGGGEAPRMSEALIQAMEAEEQALRQDAYEAVMGMLKEDGGLLNAGWIAIANALLAHETLTGEQVMKLYNDPSYDISSEFDQDHTVPDAPRVDGKKVGEMPIIRRHSATDKGAETGGSAKPADDTSTSDTSPNRDDTEEDPSSDDDK